MDSHWFRSFVVLFWLASMAWLMAWKVLPSARWSWERGPSPPVTSHSVAQEAAWEIHWNGRPIGRALSRVQQATGGARRVASVVQFEELPIGEMVGELFGVFGRWFAPGKLPRLEALVPTRVQTQMRLDAAGSLHGFTSRVHFGQMQDVVRFRGMVEGEKLRVSVILSDELAQRSGLTSGEFPCVDVDLPANMPISDGLAPFAHVESLEVGQSWTFRALRPVPLGRPFRMARAEVRQRDIMMWEGAACEVLRVILTDADSSGLSAAKAAYGELWVRPDGMVLKQRMQLADAAIEFVRTPQSPAAPGELP